MEQTIKKFSSYLTLASQYIDELSNIFVAYWKIITGQRKTKVGKLLKAFRAGTLFFGIVLFLMAKIQDLCWTSFEYAFLSISKRLLEDAGQQSNWQHGPTSIFWKLSNLSKEKFIQKNNWASFLSNLGTWYKPFQVIILLLGTGITLFIIFWFVYCLCRTIGLENIKFLHHHRNGWYYNWRKKHFLDYYRSKNFNVKDVKSDSLYVIFKNEQEVKSLLQKKRKREIWEKQHNL